MTPFEPPRQPVEDAAAWCVEMADGPLSDERQQAFDAWLAQSDTHLATFERSSAMWRRIGDAADSPELVDMRERALASLRRRNQWRRARQALSGRAVALAATVLLMLAGGAWWWQTAPQSYRTGIGERRVVMLEDGSRASLDAATQIDVRMQGDRRQLHLLAGRAKFDVAKDPLKPFSVRAGDKLIVATGTSFSVETIDGRLHVVLYEGSVAILDLPPGGTSADAAQILPRHGGGDETDLSPGEELVVNMAGPSQARLVKADPVRSLAWEAGQLVFDDERLRLAAGRIERYSAQRIEVDDRVGDLRVNGVFNTGDVEAFATGIEQTLPVRVARRPDRLTISPR